MNWLLVAFLAAGAGNSTRHALPLDGCGAPVRDDAGRPIEYSRVERETRPCLVPATRPATQPAELPSSSRAHPAIRGFASYGSGIGLSNIVVAGVPPASGLGPVEIYLGGGLSTFGANDYWHALRYSSTRQTYEDVFVSERMPAGITRLAMADLSGDARQEIVAALSSGQILVYDQLSKRALPGFSTGLDDLRGLLLRDLDGDGKAEVIVTSPNSLRVFGGSGAFRWEVPGVGGNDVVAGQMDADPALEIAVSSGSVIDAASRTAQWTYANGFGSDLEAADIDADGREELVASAGWYFVWAYDVDTQLPKWSIPIDLDIGAIRLANVDADPVIELLVGEGQWGSVLAFDTVTQAQEWAIANPDHGVTHVALGEVDGDASLELLWGAGATSTGEDHLHIASLATRTIEWQSIHLDGPFVGPETGDVDGDGRPELVFASTTSNSGYDSGRVVVLDAATFAVRAISPESGVEGWTGLHDLKLRNVDSDPAFEIVIATDYLYDGLLRIYDFDGPTHTFSERWTNVERPDGSPFYSVEVADLDADGNLEVIAGGGRAHTGADGVFVYVFDLATGLREWRTFQLGSTWSAITAVAVLEDGAGHPDLVAMVDDSSIYVFDGVTRTPLQIIDGAFTALGPGSSPAGRSFLAGTAGGVLQRYDRAGSSYGLAASHAAAPAPIEGVRLIDKGGLVAVGQQGRLSLYQWGGADPLWTSADYGPGVGHSLAIDSRYWYTGGAHATVAFSPRYPVREAAEFTR
jgi:WD40 repeat protein